MSRKLTILVGGTPSGEGKVECSCSYEGRCERHAAMMADIAHLYWDTKDYATMDRVLAHADGYGEVGFVPDWSGVRDSSAYAVEQMHAELKREGR